MRRISLRIALIVMSICIIIMMSVSAWAVPGVINFQGKLTDPNNDPVEDYDYFITFKIYPVQSEGTHLWMEVQKVTVVNGVYNVQLGEITPLPVDLFENEELYLEISIYNYSENQDEVLSPRQRLTSSPYAIKAAKAGDADTLAGQPSAYYAVAKEVQKRVEGKCGPGESIREIKSDGTVVCEKDDVDDAVSDPGGRYPNMSVGHANNADRASSAGDADTVNGLKFTDSSNRLYYCGFNGILDNNGDKRYEFFLYWPVNWGQGDCLNSICAWAISRPAVSGKAHYGYYPRGGGNPVGVANRDCQ